MSRAKKLWIITAVILVIVGLGIFAGVMTAYDWDFNKLNTENYETNTYEIDEGLDITDVEFKPSDSEVCKVVCHEQEKVKHSVVVQDGVLTIRLEDNRKWYDQIAVISFSSPKITVYLPEEKYTSLFIDTDTGDISIPKDFTFENIEINGDTSDVECCASVSDILKIKLSTGDIKVNTITAGELDLSVTTGNIKVDSVKCGDVQIGVSTGKVRLNNVECSNLTSEGSTGDMILNNVIAVGSFSIKRSTGDVTFKSCDASEIIVRTDTGDVTGTLRSEKLFITKTDTGKVEVPETTGNRCEIITDTGDIKIKLSCYFFI